MPVTTGSRLGPYEIVAPLGAGGMGEVYRARDTRLDRDVAIKALPDLFAKDAERVARFEREARLLASVNHPNIGGIHGVEEADGARYLILEFIDGQSLAGRIRAGRLSIEEALTLARQILDALEAAHEKGIVHRDLKPGNIMLTAAGQVKVLDFGLARSVDADPASSVANSPTLTFAGTRMGVILGTAAYMSPEQAKGRAADKRSDVWAFGCVLYEMLTGRPAFEGDDISDTLANILKSDVDWRALPPETPAPVRRLLQRCLQRDRKLRLRDAGDARLELDEPATNEAAAITPGASSGLPSRERLLWMAVVGVLAAAAIGTIVWARRPLPVPAETRLEIATPGRAEPISFALSPDGRHVVFVAPANGPQQLWVRPLDRAEARALARTEGATYPFWSPDSRSVGFFADGQLKAIDRDGGAPRTLARATNGRGGSWREDGTILFAPFAGSGSGLSRISAGGGEPVAVTTTAAGQLSHRFPQWLPGGDRFLYFVNGAAGIAGVYLASTDGSMNTRLVDADAPAIYVPGWLLIVRQGSLQARGFDPIRGALSDRTVTIADGVAIDPSVYSAAVSASATGLIAYRAGTGAQRQLTWFDRTGRSLGMLGAPDGTLVAPELSPDGSRAAVVRTVQGQPDVWIMDGPRTTRATLGSSQGEFPIWSFDGARIIFRSSLTGTAERTNVAGGWGLFMKRPDGTSALTSVLESNDPPLAAALDASRDGRFILYAAIDPKTRYDLWALPMSGDRPDEGKRFPVVQGQFDERNGEFSPDGNWVAYQSNESGQYEIYLRPFPPTSDGGQIPVSTAGGIQARWNPNGKEVFFIAPDGTLMAVPIAAKGSSVAAGTPTPLFQTKIVFSGTDRASRKQYDVAPDGRFLINVSLDDATASPIVVVQNWRASAE